MSPVCATGPITRGIDIYHGDILKDPSQLIPSGIQYAMLKCFEKTKDPAFASRWQLMKHLGLVRGAYDFFHPGLSVYDQADGFVATVGETDPQDSLWLDLETLDLEPTGEVREASLAWLTQVEQKSRKTPGIYIGPYFAQSLMLDARFLRFPLWIAQYGVQSPLVPNPWTKWSFWQNSEGGSVPGIVGHVDTDIYNGTLDQLKVQILSLNLE